MTFFIYFGESQTMAFEDVCVFTGHDGVNTGVPDEIAPLIEKHIPDPENGIFFSDFDGCLSPDDFGITCFFEKLHNGEYWKWSPKQFSKLLLPTQKTNNNIVSYSKLIKFAIANNGIDPKIKERAKKLQNLQEKLNILYVQIQTETSPGLRNKFAKKMLEFDELILSLEEFFMPFFGNQIFSRLRFFAGKSHTDAKNLAATTIEKGKLRINKDLFYIYENLKKNGAEGRIISTNLMSFIREAVRITILSDIFSEQDVHATKMRGTRGKGNEALRYQNLISGEPVFGTRKAQILKQEIVEKEKKNILSVGDSTSSDGTMLAESLKSGGSNIIVVPENADVAKVAKIFESRLAQCLEVQQLTEEQKQRMWYLQSKNFVDSRRITT